MSRSASHCSSVSPARLRHSRRIRPSFNRLIAGTTVVMRTLSPPWNHVDHGHGKIDMGSRGHHTNGLRVAVHTFAASTARHGSHLFTRVHRRRRSRVRFGRYYEEFEVGAVYKHWPGKTVTEYDDHLFCLITMNHHPLHLDSHYAAETTDFGRNVVVGNYIYSLLLGMSVPDVSGKAIANLEVESLKHIKPTFHGDTIYGETEVLDKTPSKSKDDRGVVYVETRGYKQDGTVVCVFRRKVMVPKQSYGDSRGGEQPGRPEPKE
ncbi:MAG TPA: MaoC family dehydratase [Pseudonocardiaceae bacterium]|nr:MaoC family dehydratase [Pseudonocardiaceae bacterium]